MWLSFIEIKKKNSHTHETRYLYWNKALLKQRRWLKKVFNGSHCHHKLVFILFHCAYIWCSVVSWYLVHVNIANQELFRYKWHLSFFTALKFMKNNPNSQPKPSKIEHDSLFDYNVKRAIKKSVQNVIQYSNSVFTVNWNYTGSVQAVLISCTWRYINSLAPGKFEWNFRHVILNRF